MRFGRPDVVMRPCAESEPVARRCPESELVARRCLESEPVVRRCAVAVPDDGVRRCALLGRCPRRCCGSGLAVREPPGLGS